MSSDTEFSLETGNLEDPIALSLNVPFELGVDARFRSEQNYRFFGGCNHLSRDSYNISGDASGTAEVLAIFDLDTEIQPQPNGEVDITITPDIFLDFNLNDPQIDVNVSGVNPLAQAVGATASIISGTTELTDWIFDGKSLEGILTDRGIELATNGVPTLYSGVSGEVLTPLTEEVAEYVVAREAAGITANAEALILAQIQEALELEDGKRTFTVPANLAHLIREGATYEEVLGL